MNNKFAPGALVRVKGDSGYHGTAEAVALHGYIWVLTERDNTSSASSYLAWRVRSIATGAERMFLGGSNWRIWFFEGEMELIPEAAETQEESAEEINV